MSLQLALRKLTSPLLISVAELEGWVPEEGTEPGAIRFRYGRLYLNSDRMQL
jgi:hypothetical protein